MMKYKFIVFHACLLLLCATAFFLIIHIYPHIINFKLGIISLLFMSLAHTTAGLYIIGLRSDNEKKRMFTAIAIHSTKFIFVIFFVLVLLSIKKENNYGLGIMLASLFLLYMISEIAAFLYVQKQREIEPLK